MSPSLLQLAAGSCYLSQSEKKITVCKAEQVYKTRTKSLQPIVFLSMLNTARWLYTSHSAYVATETELYGAKIDGFLYPNFM